MMTESSGTLFVNRPVPAISDMGEQVTKYSTLQNNRRLILNSCQERPLAEQVNSRMRSANG